MTDSVATSHAEDRLMTDEGVVETEPLSKKSKKGDEASSGLQQLYANMIIAGLSMFFIFLYVLSFAFESMPPPPPVPEPPPPPPPSLPNLTSVSQFSDNFISGMESGRIHTTFRELSYRNKELLEQSGQACATPWLELALITNHSLLPTERREYNNILSFASNPDVVYLNARITAKSVDTALVVMPFRFLDVKRASRVFANELTLAHAKGTLRTSNKNEAYCIQELYGWMK